VVTGAVLCLGLLLLVIAATIVISLISLYPPNQSQQAYGDAYLINYFMLQSTSSASTFIFSNSIMADSTQLSTLCANTYTNLGQKYVAGCIVDTNKAWGLFTTGTTGRRRRRQAAPFLDTISRLRVFYTNPCSKIADKGKYATNASLSTCVAQRLKACNVLVSSGTTVTQWTPVPTSMSYAVVDTGFLGYQQLIISAVQSPTVSTALTFAASVGLNSSVQSLISLGCQYCGQLPLSTIYAILGAQASVTTTLPSSTQAVG